MWLWIASALIFGALGAARVAPAELLPQLSARLIDAGPPVLRPVTAGVAFDPNNLADQATWASYVGKGNDFVCRMEATDKGAGFLMQDTRNPPSAASQYTGDLTNEMKKWFWHVNGNYEVDYDCDFEAMGLKTAFNSMGLDARPAYDDDGDPTGGHIEGFSIQHYDLQDVYGGGAIKDQHYTVDGKQYTATGGFYEFAVNRIDGAIIGMDLSSPRVAVLQNWDRPANDGELPELEYCADIYWHYWAHNNPNVKTLQIYGAHNVINVNTVKLVARALRNRNTALVTWPGTSFEAGTEEFKALIGSPIGQTIAQMLIRHKRELGLKHITKVTVVLNDKGTRRNNGENMHIFYTIADVPQDEITDPEQGLAVRAENKVLGVRNEGNRMIRHIAAESKVLGIRNAGKNVIRVHTMTW